MRYLICSILLFCNNSGFSESIQEKRLALEYARFVSNDSAEIVDLTCGVSRLYLEAEQFEEASTELERYEQPYRRHLTPEYWYCRALTEFFLERYDQAYALTEVLTITGDTTIALQVLKIMCTNYMGDWRTGGMMLRRLQKRIGEAQDVSKVYGGVPIEKLKNPHTAQRLSSIIPGLGQAYAGKPGRGLASFVLVGGSASYAIAHALTGYYVTGALTGVLMFVRFYQGGKAASVRYAEQHNQETIRMRAAKLNHILIDYLANSGVDIDLLHTKLN